MSDNFKKKNRARRGGGRLYIRTPDRKEHPAGSRFKGVYWLEYRVNGKRVRKKLLYDNGEPITDLAEAEKERARITGYLVASDKKEQLQVIRAKLEAAEDEYNHALEDANPPLLIENAWEEYLGSHLRPDSGEGTLYNYRGHWGAFCDWLKTRSLDIVYMRDVTPQVALDYAAHLNSRKVSPNTFNKHISFLILYFRVLEEPARILNNPFLKIQKKKLKTQARRELSVDELKTILDNAEGELKLLLYLGTFTGLRLGDCCTLKWREVNFDGQVITRKPNKTKGRNPRPVKVGIPSALLEELGSISKSNRKGYVLPCFAEQYNYTAESGKHTHRTRITNRIQKHILDICKIPIHAEGTGVQLVPAPDNLGEMMRISTGRRAVVEVGFHSLRHTYVSLHAERGTPQAVVQSIVGHGNPAMTEHYTHIGVDSARKAAEALDVGIVNACSKPPVPDWVAEELRAMSSENWREKRDGLLAEAE